MPGSAWSHFRIRWKTEEQKRSFNWKRHAVGSFQAACQDLRWSFVWGGWIPCCQKPCEYSSELQHNSSEFCRQHKNLSPSFTSLNWGTYFNRVLVQGFISEVSGAWEDVRKEKSPGSRWGLAKVLPQCIPLRPTSPSWQPMGTCPCLSSLGFEGLMGSLTVTATLLSHGKGSLGGSCLSPSLLPKASTTFRKVCQPDCAALALGLPQRVWRTCHHHMSFLCCGTCSFAEPRSRATRVASVV